VVSPTLSGRDTQEHTTTMRDPPSCPGCGDNDWSVPAELCEPCYLRFDSHDTADFADGPGPRVYLRHADAQFNPSGRVFCTSCGWEPSPTDPRSLHVNEPLLRQRLVGATLDHEGTWPTVDDQSRPPWPPTYDPT
jgi:hypothetical protein